MKDITAYKAVVERSGKSDSISFQYSTKTIPITRKTFDSLVILINESGYWSLPRESDCDNIPTDAAGFTLEANTPDKYKIVGSAVCPNDFRKFTYACQAIINHAGLKNKIDLIWKVDYHKILADTLSEIPLSNPIKMKQ